MNTYFFNGTFYKILHCLYLIQKYLLFLFLTKSFIENFKKSDFSFMNFKIGEKEEYIIKDKKCFLKTRIIKKFNSFLKLCQKGKLIDKNKYPLLKNPKITIIVPIYNGGKYLNYSIRTIQNQKLKEIEIILIDDCSTDDSLNYIKKLMEEDSRIRLIKNYRNRKILYSKSMAALNSNGEYILELDQDDMFLRDDLFDIIYNEAKNNNLDLVQFRDFIKSDFFFEKKTRINFNNKHWIFPKKTFSMNETEFKATIFKNSNNYLLWGLLILSGLYKKAIYNLWEFIMNYQLIFNEDYITTTMISVLAHNYKYLNMFGIVHLVHPKATSFNCFQQNSYHLSNIIFPSYLNNYYIRNNPKNIYLMFNYINSHKRYQTNASRIYKEIFQFNIRNLLFNNYLLKSDKNETLFAFNIGKNQSFFLSTYAYIMDSKEFSSIMSFQNSVYNLTKIYKKNKYSMINYKRLNNSMMKKLRFHYIYINDSKSFIDINQIIKLKFKKKKNQIKIDFTPIISIIIYCNEIQYLEQTLNSIIIQKNFFFFEIIIVNDNINKMSLSDNFKFNNIIIINNQNQKGIIYSNSIGIMASKGKYILLFKSGFTFAKKNILINLYNYAINNNIEILEFNLLINKDDIINENSFNLYKCQHMNSIFNTSELKYNKNYEEFDQEKELLINKLILSSLCKDIINQYKLIEYKEITYNHYDDILIYLFNERKYIFKHIDQFGVIENINQVNSLELNKLINDNEQKLFDSIFYINFLFDNSQNTHKDKKIVYDKFVNILGLIYNKLVSKSNLSIKLFRKFMDCEYINETEKLELNFFYNSLNN